MVRYSVALLVCFGINSLLFCADHRPDCQRASYQIEPLLSVSGAGCVVEAVQRPDAFEQSEEKENSVQNHLVGPQEQRTKVYEWVKDFLAKDPAGIVMQYLPHQWKSQSGCITFEEGKNIRRVSVSADGRYAVFLPVDGVPIVMDMQNHNCRVLSSKCHVSYVCFSPDSQTLALGLSDRVQFLRVPKKRSDKWIVSKVIKCQNTCDGVFSPNGKWLAVFVTGMKSSWGVQKPELCVYDIQTDKKMVSNTVPSDDSLHLHRQKVLFSPSGELLVVGTGFGVHIYETQNWSLEQTLQTGEIGSATVETISFFNPVSKLIRVLVAKKEGEVVHWHYSYVDPATGEKKNDKDSLTLLLENGTYQVHSKIVGGCDESFDCVFGLKKIGKKAIKTVASMRLNCYIQPCASQCAFSPSSKQVLICCNNRLWIISLEDAYKNNAKYKLDRVWNDSR